MRDILIFGYYGKGNLGDEAILQSILASLESRGLTRERVIVASFDVDDTTARHGVVAVRSRRWLELLRTVVRSRSVIFGGGGYHLHGLPLAYEVIIAAIAKLLRAKVCLETIGVEPIHGWLNQRVAGTFLRLCDRVSVRDQYSASEVYRVSGRRVKVAADPVLSMNVPSVVRSERIGRPLVAVSLLTSRNAPKYERVRVIFPKLVDYLVDEIGADVLLISTSKGEGDVDVALEVLREVSNSDHVLAVPWTNDLQSLGEVLSGVEFAVGMRLHFLVLCSLMGIPFAAISRSPKIQQFANRVGQPVVGDIESGYDLISRAISKAYSGRVKTIKTMAIRTRTLGKAFQRDMEELASFLLTEGGSA